MELNQKQREGLEIAVSRYRKGYPYTCIAGYAGTGKSTLVQFIINALGIERPYVAYAAYTGKAALVLKQKGCLNAETTHRLLYNTKPRNDGTFYHIPKTRLDYNYKLIVIDEVSMLPKRMWDLLLSHHVHVIALGDPGQLPPVASDNTDILASPHIFLDEIMRQEAESEIINCSMNIRQGKGLVVHDGAEVKVLPHGSDTIGMYKWADQILCAKNTTRQYINNVMREVLFNTTDRFPIEGDKIICLRNNWDIANEMGDCLINGMTGVISNIHEEPVHAPASIYTGKKIVADFTPDFYTEMENELFDTTFHNVVMDYNIFMTGEPTLNKDNFKKLAKYYKPNEFDYGYSTTVWKAQGSEYNKVLLFEESYPWEEDLHKRYLYTGITRSRSKIVIIMK